MTKEQEYLLIFKSVHKDKYDYSKFSYVNSKTKCTFICNTCHGEWYAIAASHRKGHGCPYCARKVTTSKLTGTKESWMQSLLKRHPQNSEKFDYSNTVYLNAKSKVCIGCKTCGKVFYQTPNDHLGGKGCGYCVGLHKTSESFIAEAILKFPDNAALFDYSRVKYKKDGIPVDIKCRVCDRYFSQTPTKHLQGHGCNLCPLDRQTKEHFISRAIQLVSNPNRLDFRYCVYDNYLSQVVIKCLDCGELATRSPAVILARHAIGCSCDKGKGGFNTDSEANLYLVSWFNKDSRFLKIGITNNEVRLRCNQAKKRARGNGLNFEILNVFKTKGRLALEVEQKLLKEYYDEFSFASRELFPDGWTETISLSRYEDILKYCKEYLNEQSS